MNIRLVSSKQMRDKSASSKKRFESLYEDSKKRRSSMDNKINAMSESNPRGCTFTPELKAKKSVRTTSGGGTPIDRMHSLYENAKTIEKKKKETAERLLNQQEHECTFKPKISEKSARRQSTGGSRLDELYSIHKEKEQRNQAIKSERDTEGCTFSPVIIRKGAPPRVNPGHIADRLNRYQKDLDEKKKKMRLKKIQAENEECTFTPKLECSQEALATPTPPVHERLYMQAVELDMKKEKLAEQTQQDLGITFKPAISRPENGLSTPAVFERLAIPKAGVDSAVFEEDNILNIVEELRECSFQPSVNVKGNSDKRSVFDRLTVAKKSPSKEEHSPREEYSWAKARKQKQSVVPIWERLNAEAKIKAERISAAKASKEKSEVDSCSFAPSIGTAALKDSGNAPVWDRLQVNKKEKWNRLDQKKMELELENCTFEPALVASFASPSPKSSGYGGSPRSPVRMIQSEAIQSDTVQLEAIPKELDECNK